MITFRTSGDVSDDHRVTLTLPPEVPTGRSEFIVSVAPVSEKGKKLPRSSLADWAEEQAEHWGARDS